MVVGSGGSMFTFLSQISNLLSQMFSLLLLVPWLWISFSYVRCPSSVTWAIQDFLQCLSGSLHPGKGQWGLAGDGGVELHPPKPTRAPRHGLTATVPESGSAQRPLLLQPGVQCHVGLWKGILLFKAEKTFIMFSFLAHFTAHSTHLLWASLTAFPTSDASYSHFRLLWDFIVGPAEAQKTKEVLNPFWHFHPGKLKRTKGTAEDGQVNPPAVLILGEVSGLHEEDLWCFPFLPHCTSFLHPWAGKAPPKLSLDNVRKKPSNSNMLLLISHSSCNPTWASSKQWSQEPGSF